jgi:hypothetical protein
MKIEQYLEGIRKSNPEQFTSKISNLFPVEFKYLMEELEGCQEIKNDKRGNAEFLIKVNKIMYKVEYKNKILNSVKVNKVEPQVKSTMKSKVEKEVKKNVNVKSWKNKKRSFETR